MPAPNKDLFTTHRSMRVDESACTGCGVCAACCPVEGLIVISGGVARITDERACLRCFRCVERCVHHAMVPVTVASFIDYDFGRHASSAPGQPRADDFDF